MTTVARPRQLISYIAPSAPATRRPASGEEPFLRPEIGFTPRWYRQHLDIDFGERWHTNLRYRRETIVAMRQELKRRFGDLPIGGGRESGQPPDLLTGTFGGCFVAGLYGAPIEYCRDNWPWSRCRNLTDREVAGLEPPDLDSNPLFASLMEQVDAIESENGQVEGYMNWQGVLNNAYRLRGERLFLDMATQPERARHVFQCVAVTMVDGAMRLYERQRSTGVDVRHFTVSNCMVNMVSPRHYQEFLLPHDRRISETFGLIGVHNCAWRADPYMEHYSTVPNLGYVDMGIDSDLPRARELFPHARRAIMYTPMDVVRKDSASLREDLERTARDFGPCDIVFADIDAGIPDHRVAELAGLCAETGERMEAGE